uniref:PH domain-containing protein n=1 Tax=Acrobeloides nanus TaxID=290746 RepID=A0A914DBR4_9BILA
MERRWKRGWRYKGWKRRWFVFNDKCLYYFELTPEKEPRGIIPLETIKVRIVEDKSKQHTFELYSSSTDVIKACKTDSDGRLVEGRHAVYRLAASNSDEMHSWINAIQRSINKDPFFDMLQLRRKRMSTAPSDSSSSRG